MDNKFYVYAYLRTKDSQTATKGTPYYIGKGCGNRAIVKHHNKTAEHIVYLKENISEDQAFAFEVTLIAW
jgi:hypothetical protein